MYEPPQAIPPLRRGSMLPSPDIRRFPILDHSLCLGWRLLLSLSCLVSLGEGRYSQTNKSKRLVESGAYCGGICLADAPSCLVDLSKGRECPSWWRRSFSLPACCQQAHPSRMFLCNVATFCLVLTLLPRDLGKKWMDQGCLHLLDWHTKFSLGHLNLLGWNMLSCPVFPSF